MILNIYKLSEFDLNILNELPDNIEIINNDKNEIRIIYFVVGDFLSNRQFYEV